MKIESYAMNLQAAASSSKTQSVTEANGIMQRVISPEAMQNATNIQIDSAQLGNGRMLGTWRMLSPTHGVWVWNNGAEQQNATQEQGNNNAAFLMLSQDALDHSARQQQHQPKVARINAPKIGMQMPDIPDKDRMKLLLLERVISALTGREIRFTALNDMLRNNRNSMQQQQPQPVNMPGINISGGNGAQGINIANGNGQITIDANGQITGRQVLIRTETYHESQQMAFQAQGVINTSDGRQIHLDLNIFSSYEFMSSTSVVINGGTGTGNGSGANGGGGGGGSVNLADPLILNFDGTLPEFTKDRYEFDITIDGSLENIFMPTNGSAFLALDKNGNGVIDDGSELFGAQSGNGFAELAAYDSDGNGWIDENDEVFNALKLMFVDKESGETILMTLKESGVGAIYLGSVQNGYEIKAEGNELAGVVQRSGIFLNENGTAGSIHHIDLSY